jgi:hypothetical protein
MLNFMVLIHKNDRVRKQIGKFVVVRGKYHRFTGGF